MTKYICTDEEHDGHDVSGGQEEYHYESPDRAGHRHLVYISWFIDCSCGTRIAGTGTMPIKEKE